MRILLVVVCVVGMGGLSRGNDSTQPIQVPLTAPAAPSTRLPLPLDVHGGKVITLQTGDVCSIPLNLRNTSNADLKLSAIVLGIAQLDKADGTGLVRSVETKPVATEPKSFLHGATDNLRISVGSIDDPGIYEVETEVRDVASVYSPVTYKTMVYRRHPWWCAALFVGLGALLAAGVRLYVDGSKSRLVLRRRIAFLLDQIRVVRGQASSDGAVAAARALELDVADRGRYVRWGGAVAELEKVVGRSEARLELLVEIIDATAQVAKLDPDRQSTYRKTLDDALAIVRLDPGDDAKVAAKRTEVAALGLAANWREQIATEITILDAQIGVRIPAAGAAYAAQLQPIAKALADARQKLTADKLGEANAALETIRISILDASTTELSRLIATAPEGLVDDAWSEHRIAISDALAEASESTNPWPLRRAAFKGAQDEYIRAAVSGLIQLAKNKATSISSTKTRMDEIVAELTAALKEPVNAASLYAARRREIDRAGKPAVTPGVVGAARPVSAAVASIWLPLPLGGGNEEPSTFALRDFTRLDRTIKSTNVLVSVAVLVVAVATGVNTLWSGDFAWGSHANMLSAFLWGAGVQAAGNAFAGLIALRTKLGAAGPT